MLKVHPKNYNLSEMLKVYPKNYTLFIHFKNCKTKTNRPKPDDLQSTKL